MAMPYYKEEGVDRLTLYDLVGVELYHILFAHLKCADRCDMRDSYKLGLPLPGGVLIPEHMKLYDVQMQWQERQRISNLRQAVVVSL